MRDASALPFEENIAEIKRCVDYFHAYNIPVEAELGHVGNETVYEEALAEYAYTDPSQAKEFESVQDVTLLQLQLVMYMVFIQQSLRSDLISLRKYTKR